MKKCSKCKEFKKSNEFYKNSYNKDGLQSWCKECQYKRTNYYKIRWEILLRDNFTCQYCGRTPQDGAKLRVDHIIPKSKDGDFDKNNLITSCEICNLGKSDILLDEHDINRIKEKCL